jgi:hypothetical protein
MPANQRMPASRCPQGPASIAFCSVLGGFAVAQAIQRRDPGLETAGDLANVGSCVNYITPLDRFIELICRVGRIDRNAPSRWKRKVGR